MKQLTIKEIAPYLPYGIKVQWYKSNDREAEISTLTASSYGFYIDRHQAKPILRSLSDLTKEIEHNGERFVPMERLLEQKYPKWAEKYKNSRYSEISVDLTPKYATSCFFYQANFDLKINLSNPKEHSYLLVEKLLEWHFDIFGLIDKGLAVDINTLNE